MDGRGVNVAVFSEVAERIDVCLFDAPAAPAESERTPLPGSTGGIRHGYFPDLRPGRRYGPRAAGPYDPEQGPRCNEHEVLVDPYAKAVGRDLRYDDALYGWNCGTEGPTDDEQITVLRRRQVRNLLATLVLSQGVPMLRAGDELGHTQQGNNNAYCQDNELTWLDWELDEERRDLLEFTRRLLRLRTSEPVFRRRTFFQGRPPAGSSVKDVYWVSPAGREMQQDDWSTPLSCLGVLLVGEEIGDLDDDGTPITGGSYLLPFNAAGSAVDFVLPERLAALGEQSSSTPLRQRPPAGPSRTPTGSRPTPPPSCW